MRVVRVDEGQCEAGVMAEDDSCDSVDYPGDSVGRRVIWKWQMVGLRPGGTGPARQMGNDAQALGS
jgi:hypothetical protein